MKQNDALAAKGNVEHPFVYGKHGIGKTEMVIQFAKKTTGPMFIVLLLNLKKWVIPWYSEIFDPTPDDPNSGDEYTVYRPPWLRDAIDNIDKSKPDFILDDLTVLGNESYKVVAISSDVCPYLSLPPKWQIILTANPEGGEYTVTEMDDAMITRMIYVTMTFNAKTWAEWAQSDGLMHVESISF